MKIFSLLIYILFFHFATSFKTQTPFLFLLKQNYNDKKIITLSPGGFRGFYVLGLCKYIKENYLGINYFTESVVYVNRN